MRYTVDKPMAILYGQGYASNSLFPVLASRGVSFRTIDVPNDNYTLDESASEFSLLYNDLTGSADAWDRTCYYIRHLEYTKGRRTPGIINGSRAIEVFSDKLLQLSVFKASNVPTAKTHVIVDPRKWVASLPSITFPVLVSGIRRPRNTVLKFKDRAQLKNYLVEQTTTGDALPLLLQEYHPPKKNSFIRLHTVAGKVIGAQPLFGIDEQIFEWPTEKLHTVLPSIDIIEAAEEIVRNAGVEVGCVEYFKSQRDNEVYFYAIRPSQFANAELSASHSQFVADYLERRLSKVKEVTLGI
jgi:hypothetical protein